MQIRAKKNTQKPQFENRRIFPCKAINFSRQCFKVIYFSLILDIVKDNSFRNLREAFKKGYDPFRHLILISVEIPYIFTFAWLFQCYEDVQFEMRSNVLQIVMLPQPRRF